MCKVEYLRFQDRLHPGCRRHHLAGIYQMTGVIETFSLLGTTLSFGLLPVVPVSSAKKGVVC